MTVSGRKEPKEKTMEKLPATDAGIEASPPVGRPGRLPDRTGQAAGPGEGPHPRRRRSDNLAVGP
jgi:hypothetical protein